MAYIEERNQDATIFVGDLDPKVNEAILWELFLQAGPVVNVHIPRDKLTKEHNGYGFVEFKTEADADYAIRIMNLIKLYGKPLRVNKVLAARSKMQDVGANLFIGNLDPDCDEKTLQDIFSAFGNLIAPPKIMRDPETGKSRGFAFVSYDSFESSDAAIEAMHGQHIMNRPITVTYAFKKDSKHERHGSLAERILAANNPNRRLPPAGAIPMPNFVPPTPVPQLGPPVMSFQQMDPRMLPRTSGMTPAATTATPTPSATPTPTPPTMPPPPPPPPFLPKIPMMPPPPGYPPYVFPPLPQASPATPAPAPAPNTTSQPPPSQSPQPPAPNTSL